MKKRMTHTPRPFGQPRFDTWGRWCRGNIVSIEGEPGRFRIQHFRENGTGALEVTVYGGRKGAEQYRTFFVSRLKTQHRSTEL